MPKGIMRSVGAKASNEPGDVKLIQIYLNLNRSKHQKRLEEDGLIGKNTIEAIKHFQVHSVGMTNADGRVDPNGKTFSYLTMYIEASNQDAAEANARLSKKNRAIPPVTEKKVLSHAGLSHLSVTYKSIPAERQLVSEYSKNIIRLALKQAGMEHAVITSTLRFPEQQAAIMLRNAKIDLTKQFRLYGSAGDNVLKVYQDNKSKSDKELVSLMTSKINELADIGVRVSKHCVSQADYAKLNVIDIGLGSTRAVNKNFSAPKLTTALKSLVKDGYIQSFIDETGKSNACWHIEIKPNGKAIFDHSERTILVPTRFMNRGTFLC